MEAPASKSSANLPLLRRVVDFFELPETRSPTLPEVLVQKTGLKSWFLASILIGVMVYVVSMGVATLDGGIYAPSWSWSGSLVYAVMTTYLLLIQAPLRRLLQRSIDEFMPFLPATERYENLIVQAHRLRRPFEWLAVGAAIITGWFLKSFGPVESLRLWLDIMIGTSIMFGLTGWYLYMGLARGRLLGALHSQAQDLSLFKQSPPYAPIYRWAFGVVMGMVGGFLITTLLVGPSHLFDNSTIMFYTVLVVFALLIMSFSRPPASLVARISMFRSVFLFILVALIGTVGFWYFEKWALHEAFYATIITMTTVGYGDYIPVTGGGRIFTVFLSIVAIGIGGYAISALAAFILEGNVERLIRGKRVYKMIDRLDKHVIVCGIGSVGRYVALELYKTRTPFVIIEKDHISLEELLREIEVPYVQADATQDEALEVAGIGRARGLISALRDDKDNAFVVLTARELARKLDNPTLHIVSRVTDERQRGKAIKAGADVTISPSMVGGQQLARLMYQSEMTNFIWAMLQAERHTGQTIRLEAVHINCIRHPLLVEKLDEDDLRVMHIGQHSGALVIAVKRPGLQSYVYTPRGDEPLRCGDILIVMGTPEERARLQENDTPSGPVMAWVRELQSRGQDWLES